MAALSTQVEFYPTAKIELEQLIRDSNDLETRIAIRLAELDVQLANNEDELDIIAQSVFEWVDEQGLLSAEGLVPVEVDVDEAMLTALVQRLDLMNKRGELADRWRAIKLRGDDLKSILNVRATQSLRTPIGENQPFDFSFDDSTTTLGLEFDTPLNRRVERNLFRLALIDYNAALRSVIEAEDLIKLQIRDNVRDLDLDRNQYEIAIASAALAYERVVSTRLQLITSGSGNITARDFLEAQQDYSTSLNAVAGFHINYIRNRIDFFMSLEQLQIDRLNYWPELRNDKYPFIPNLDFRGTSPHAYGELSRGPWYSKCLRRMETVPSGEAMSHRPAEEIPQQSE